MSKKIITQDHYLYHILSFHDLIIYISCESRNIISFALPLPDHGPTHHLKLMFLEGIPLVVLKE